MTVERNGSRGRSGVGYLRVGVLLCSEYGDSGGRCQLFTICSKCLSLEGRFMQVRMLAYNATMHVSAQPLFLQFCAPPWCKFRPGVAIMYQH